MGFQLNRRAAATASLILCSVLLPNIAAAQVVVRGVLYDDANGAPVRGTVMLVDPRNDAAVVHATTDSLGQFNLQAATGVYQIAAVRAGYTSVLSAPVSFQNGERLVVRVPIAQTGDPQHQIGVVEHVRPVESAVQSERRASVMTAYEARRATGIGLHYDRKDLAKANVATLGEFLQSVPGLSVRDPSTTSSMQMSRTSSLVSGLRGPAGACHMGWFVDGHRIDLPGQNDPMTDGLGELQIDAIESLEIFRGLSEMPPEFAAPDLRCGAVAIWSRRSN